jgi:hypothetical protein
MWLFMHTVFKQFYLPLMQNLISDTLMWSSFPCVQNTRQMKTEDKTGHYEGFMDYLTTVFYLRRLVKRGIWTDTLSTNLEGEVRGMF